MERLSKKFRIEGLDKEKWNVPQYIRPSAISVCRDGVVLGGCYGFIDSVCLVLTFGRFERLAG